jgi:hypothetical protein
MEWVKPIGGNMSTSLLNLEVTECKYFVAVYNIIL